MFKRGSVFIFVLSLVVVTGCAENQGTSTGNPVVQLSFDSYNSAAFTKVAASNDFSAQALSSLKLCFKRLRFKKFGETTNPDPTIDEDNIDFELGEKTISDLGTFLGNIEVPAGTYTRIEFDLEDSCASAKSVQLTNTNGSFTTNERITIKFNGTFNHSVDEPLILTVQPITSALNTVAADNQIRPKAEGASGSY